MEENQSLEEIHGGETPAADTPDPGFRYYVLYTKDLGLIISEVAVAPAVIEALANWQNCFYLEGRGRPGLDRVVDGQVVPREEMPIVVTGTTLTGVPFPSALKINDGREDTWYEITEDVVELDLPAPGTYHLAIYLDPYLRWEYTLENPA